jgi:glycosyltransferase involved in cell wall biosynthesis
VNTALNLSITNKMQGKKILSVIIPAYNESNTIDFILDKIKAVQLGWGIEMEIIVVNDCSTDHTMEVVEQFRIINPELTIQLIEHEENKGKGAAIKTGIAHATGAFIIIQDADLEYDPNEYNILLQPMIDGHADVVYGSRFMGGKPHRILFFWHSIGNKILTGLSNVFTDLNLTDMETCYKLFRA